MAVWIDTNEKEGELHISTHWEQASFKDYYELLKGVFFLHYWGLKITNPQMILKFKASNKIK